MSKPAALPLFGDAYLADTTHLTTEEHGAYFLLMLAAWRQEDCSLPLDDKKLARIVGMSARKWTSVKATILEFWQVNDGRIYQPRLSKEHDYVCKKSEANRKSAEARWKKQCAEKQHFDECERTTERNAPPPPPISNKDDKSSFVISENDDNETKPSAKPKITAAEIDDAIGCYKLGAAQAGWPELRKIDANRRSKLISRLKENGLEGWKEALRKALRSEQLGRDPPGWFNFGWLTKNSDNILKVLEGNYDKRFGSNGNSGSEPKLSATLRAAEALEKRFAAEGGGQGGLFRSAGDDGPRLALPSR